MKTTRPPSRDRLSGEVYRMLVMLLFGAPALLITMRLLAEVIDAPALSPGL